MNIFNGWDEKPIGWEETNDRYKLKHVNHSNETIPYLTNMDVIIVMAGGLACNGDIHPWVKKRLDMALDIYTKKPNYILCTGGGTYHKPPLLNENKFVIHESTACAEYLINNGVNPLHIIKEWGSYDSLASVYFCLLLTIVPRDWTKICVITSSFHMERVKEIFKWIFNLYENGKYKLMFVSTTDKDNVPEDILKSRIEREQNSIKSLKNIIKNIKSMKDLNKWLYTEHKAYSCAYLNQKEEIPHNIKLSY